MQDKGLETDEKENRIEEKVEKFQENNKKSKAQMIFPISKILKRMKKCDKDLRVSRKAALPVCVALETLTADILALALNCSLKEKNQNKIRPSHISKIFRSNPDFQKLLGPNILIPYTHEANSQDLQEIIEID